jgi:hypothetical protein
MAAWQTRRRVVRIVRQPLVRRVVAYSLEGTG